MSKKEYDLERAAIKKMLFIEGFVKMIHAVKSDNDCFADGYFENSGAGIIETIKKIDAAGLREEFADFIDTFSHNTTEKFYACHENKACAVAVFDTEEERDNWVKQNKKSEPISEVLAAITVGKYLLDESKYTKDKNGVLWVEQIY